MSQKLIPRQYMLRMRGQDRLPLPDDLRLESGRAVTGAFQLDYAVRGAQLLDNPAVAAVSITALLPVQVHFYLRFQGDLNKVLELEPEL